MSEDTIIGILMLLVSGGMGYMAAAVATRFAKSLKDRLEDGHERNSV